jgi:hypothetical protein
MRVPTSHRRFWLTVVSAACLTIVGLALAQERPNRPAPEPPPNASTDPLFRGFEFRSIGPATMMGRVDDIVGAEQDPMTMYVGFATGGLWKSTDGGNHWKAVFDNQPNTSIGAVAVAPSDLNVVYVGTGEANNRQSSSIGDGVWGSTDGGKTWTHLGLEDTQSIGRIVVDSTNPKIVYVAANGHLFGPNPERGLYKSSGRRKDLEEIEIHRSRHRIHGRRNRSFESKNSLRGFVLAAAHLVGLQRRRTELRAVEDDRRR